MSEESFNILSLADLVDKIEQGVKHGVQQHSTRLLTEFAHLRFEECVVHTKVKEIEIYKDTGRREYGVQLKVRYAVTADSGVKLRTTGASI